MAGRGRGARPRAADGALLHLKQTRAAVRSEVPPLLRPMLGWLVSETRGRCEDREQMQDVDELSRLRTNAADSQGELEASTRARAVPPSGAPRLAAKVVKPHGCRPIVQLMPACLRTRQRAKLARAKYHRSEYRGAQLFVTDRSRRPRVHTHTHRNPTLDLHPTRTRARPCNPHPRRPPLWARGGHMRLLHLSG